ncbi:glycosyltransferase family 2 protein [Patescibacteria group bacterium]|nr:MAG: glycosyltransferase family 2 protein [Patescibacteria group bacterium]
MTYSFIIPAYNEAAAIGEALARVSAYAARLGDWEIVIVDDGSTDATARIVGEAAAREPRIRLLRLPQNRGKGAAVRAGMAAATGEWRIFLDADLSTEPEAFEGFRPYLSDHDVLIASRAVTGADLVARQPWWREKSGRVFNLLVRLIVGLPFRDTQCGFKCFRAPAAALFQDVATDGWAFDVDVLARARRAGLRIIELPVRWRHDATTTVRAGALFGIVRDLWRIRRLTRASERPIVRSPL